MKRAALMIAIAALSGCSALKSAAKGDMKGMAALGAKLSEASKKADEAAKTCPPEDGNIPLQEEKEIGGSVVVGLTQTAKAPYLVDGALPDIATKPEAVTVEKNQKNDLTAYVARVGRNLASFSSRPEIPWVFGVLDHPDVNAFSAPGGYVVVTTGLLTKVKNEAQLAGILGHEIGHVVLKHTVKNYAKVKHTICVPAKKGAVYLSMGLLDNAPGDLKEYANFGDAFDKPVDGSGDPNAPLAKLVNKLTDLVLDAQNKFGMGKEDEFAADKTALELMVFAGYEPTEFDSFLQIVEQSRQGFPNHPSNVDRLKELTALRNGEYAPFVASATNKPELPADVKAFIATLPAGPAPK